MQVDLADKAVLLIAWTAALLIFKIMVFGHICIRIVNFDPEQSCFGS